MGVTPPTATGADLVHDQLREQILTGVLAPGLVVSQVQLARELGVSRTPLREAVRMLQREGLVAGEANRMIRIASFSIADVEELYAVRIANEALGIRLTVPKMTATDDAALHQSLEDMARTAADGDEEAWTTFHRTFHTRLVAGSGKRLQTLLSELYDYAERYRHLYRTTEPRAMSIGAREHEQIVDACRARDRHTRERRAGAPPLAHGAHRADRDRPRARARAAAQRAAGAAERRERHDEL